jgi:hypothetical protein
MVPEIIEFGGRDGIAYAVEVRVSGIDLAKALARMEGKERFHTKLRRCGRGRSGPCWTSSAICLSLLIGVLGRPECENAPDAADGRNFVRSGGPEH